MVGRTHGVHAEPTTFGLKLALWYDETRKEHRQAGGCLERSAVGQISGAVGTFEHLSPGVEEYVCARLGLKPAPVSTQILQRDRHAEFMSVLAVIGEIAREDRDGNPAPAEDGGPRGGGVLLARARRAPRRCRTSAIRSPASGSPGFRGCSAATPSPQWRTWRSGMSGTSRTHPWSGSSSRTAAFCWTTCWPC